MLITLKPTCTQQKGEISKVNDEDKTLLNIVRSGSTWTANTAYWANHTDTTMCRRCGKEKETAEHIHWYCTALQKQRADADKALGCCNPDMLPQPVKHGIAPAMGADPRMPYWGNFPNIEKDRNRMAQGDANKKLDAQTTRCRLIAGKSLRHVVEK